LALAGEVAPIVRDIAKMAGVSARTVFQHPPTRPNSTLPSSAAYWPLVRCAELQVAWSVDERIGR
jgi:hypothetical protein